MPKKTKKTPKKTTQSVRSHNKAQNDFFFLIVITVFAALTIFAASFMNTARQRALSASQKRSLDVVQLDVIDGKASPLPTANPPKYQNPKNQ